MSLGIIFALIGVGISVGLGAIGSSFGVAHVAKVGAGLLSKEPEKFPLVITLAAIPSTQALFGLLFGFIVLIKTGLLTGAPVEMFLNPQTGWLYGLAYLAASLPVGLAAAVSGNFQGQVAAAGIKIVAEKPQNLSQAIVLAALIETFAIFGLVVSLLIVFVGIK